MANPGNPETRVDAIMAGVREDAATADEPAFPLLQIRAAEPALREASMVRSLPLLIGRTPYERLWSIINRVLRRSAAPAVEPTVNQQSEWNRVVRETLLDLTAYQEDLDGEIIRLRSERHHG